MPEIKQDLRTATMIVAANNSLHRNDANYVCNGVDDQVEIQAALDAVAAGLPTIGRVVLLEGLYVCTADITVPDYCTLEGQGSDTRVVFDGDAIVNAITIGGDYCGVKNLAALLNAGAGAALTRPNVIYGNNRDHTWLQNLEVGGDESVLDDGSDLRQCGILLIDGGYNKITNCITRNCRRHGIHINGEINDIIGENHSTSNTLHGIFLSNFSDWCNVTGNNCDLNDGNGIILNGCAICTVTGNDTDNNSLNGIHLIGSNGNSITGNTCEQNIESGIYLEDSEDNTISGNNCCLNDQNDTGFNPGILIDVDSENNQIIGNICDLNHGRGINVVGARNGIIGNQCSTNDRCGIYCNGPECQINNNLIWDNGQDAAGTYHGIELGGTADACQIEANHCNSPGDSQEDGIRLGAGASYVQVVGNFCLSGMGSGICLASNNLDCLIEGNHCSYNDDYGVAVATNTCLNSIINNNFCLSNGLEGIYSLGPYSQIVGNHLHENGRHGIFCGASRCHILSNYCDNNGTAGAGTYHGILLNGDADMSTIIGNFIWADAAVTRFTEDGIRLATGCSQVEISNNYIFHVLGSGICLVDSNASVKIADNYCYFCDDYGIEIATANGDQCTIENNYCFSNGLHGIYCAGPEGRICGNYCYLNSQSATGTYHGIDLAGTADKCQVNGNYLIDDGNWQEDGIHLEDGASYVQIVGNYCFNGKGDGIELVANNDYCLIKDNYCLENDDYGIAITAATCNENTVENNKLLGNVTGQINDAGTDTALPFIYEPVHNPDAFIGNHPAEDLPDNIVTTTRLSLYVPAEFQELVRIQAFVVAAAAGDLNYDVDTDYGKVCAAEDYNTHGAAVADQIHTCVINDIECLDLIPATTLANLAAQDLVGIQFTRDGVVGTDTIAEHVYLIGVRLQYV